MTPCPGIDLTAEALLALRHVATDRMRIGRSRDSAGALAGRKRGIGLDIHDLRHFTDGDDPRHLDAAATARSGQPHVRTYHEEEQRTVLLVADFRGPMLWGSRHKLRSVAAAESLAVAGWQVLASGGSAGVLTATDGGTQYLPPRPREASMVPIAAALAQAHGNALSMQPVTIPPALDMVLEQAGRLAQRGSTLLVATGLDQPGDDLGNVLMSLRRKVQLRLVLVLDLLQSEPPDRVLPFHTPGGAIRWGKLGDTVLDARRSFEAVGANIVEWRPGDDAQPAGMVVA